MDTRSYSKTKTKNGGRSALYFIPFGGSDIRQSTRKKKWHQTSKTNSGRSVLYFVLLGGLGNPAEPATECEVASHSGRPIASKRRNLQRGLQLQKGRSTRTVDGVLHEACQTYRETATEEEVHSHNGCFPTSSGQDLQRGLQLERMRSTRAVDGLLHQVGERYGLLHRVGETCREDSSYRGRGRLAQWTVYRIKRAKPTERTPATERKVHSHSG